MVTYRAKAIAGTSKNKKTYSDDKNENFKLNCSECTMG